MSEHLFQPPYAITACHPSSDFCDDQPIPAISQLHRSVPFICCIYAPSVHCAVAHYSCVQWSVRTSPSSSSGGRWWLGRVSGGPGTLPRAWPPDLYHPSSGATVPKAAPEPSPTAAPTGSKKEGRGRRGYERKREGDSRRDTTAAATAAVAVQSGPARTTS